MPTSFRNLVGTKAQSFFAGSGNESNLERGRVWSYTPGNDFSNYGICWTAPADGTAIVEIWGAGGSGARMCCCGGGVPGNAGAYSRRTVKVRAGCFFTGSVGFSCGNGDALCFRGCSDSTGLCWRGLEGTGCMCAQGGRGGLSFCSTGTSMFCCFGGNGFCRTGPFNDNCGIVCNFFPGIWIANAFGGNINRCGHFSCTAFFGCQGPCICSYIQHVAVPAGQHSRCGGVVSFATENNNDFSNWSGQGAHQHQAALNGLSRAPNAGIPWAYPWGFGGGCGCYDNEGCSPHVPPGHPGTAPFPCGDVRDNGRRGGHGLIRIKFIEGQ